MAAMVVLLHRFELGAVIVRVVMIMVVLVRGVDGIAHSVASVKVPVAK